MWEIEWMNKGANKRWYEASFTIIHFYPLIRKTHNFIFAVNTSIFLAVVCIRMKDVQNVKKTKVEVKKKNAQIHPQNQRSNEHRTLNRRLMHNKQFSAEAIAKKFFIHCSIKWILIATVSMGGGRGSSLSHLFYFYFYFSLVTIFACARSMPCVISLSLGHSLHSNHMNQPSRLDGTIHTTQPVTILYTYIVWRRQQQQWVFKY